MAIDKILADIYRQRHFVSYKYNMLLLKHFMCGGEINDQYSLSIKKKSRSIRRIR